MIASICRHIMLGSMTCSLLVSFASGVDVKGTNLDGTWANDVQVCKQLFEKKNNRISMTENADFYGSGFIVEGNEVRGKLERCHITSQKQDGDKTYLQAQCATDIATGPSQLALRLDGNDKLTRFFPDMPGMDLSYYRCPAMN